MKVYSLARATVVSCAAVGMFVVATSQPGSAKQAGVAPSHQIIPRSVDIGDIQEFKDAGTIHLNNIQKIMLDNAGRGYPNITIVITKVDFLNMWHDQCFILKDAKTTGGGQVKPASPAELAVLSYVFEQGIDHMVKGSSAKGTASPSNITASISPKDLGMTSEQFKQSVMQYVEGHQTRFWNEARIGLASGR